MKYRMIFFLMILATGCLSLTTHAQTKQSAFDKVQDLKLQLIELDAKQETTRLQVQQLDEALKPENIERALAGIGSTKPEELREYRRRQLLIEKKAADAQLEQLTLTRSQLEAALASAEAQAYQQSAGGWAGVMNQFRAASITPTLLGVFALSALLIVAVLVWVCLLLRRRAIERGLR